MNPAQPRHASARAAVAGVPAGQLAGALQEALQARDQERSCALAERHGALGLDPDDLAGLLIQPALEFDGALHHEKYFHTATEEFARSRPEFRWEHLVSLARVMASGYGFPAQGMEVTKEVLGV
jgi:hypothetical protein